MKKMKLTRKGFTLVEIMIVISIIGVLMAVLMPSMRGVFGRSNDMARNGGMNLITQALGEFYIDNNFFP